MSRHTLWYILGGLGAGLLLGVVWGLFAPKTSVAPTVNTTNDNANQSTTNTNTNSTATTTTRFSTADLPDRHGAYTFAADIPRAWVVEYVEGSQAINIYDPKGTGLTSLENSKIFIRFFQASSFQTLTTVDILSRTESTIVDRPAVTYQIKKKGDVADFPDQPSWRNDTHRVTDIRTSDASPATFYVFAKAPDVSDTTFDAFLQSLQLTVIDATSRTVYPLEDFLARITKKRFGQLITPQNSPVSPERFSGYHTGVDAEATAAEAGQDVPVYAIAAGRVVLRRTVDGYGGVVMIEHKVDASTVTALYGHLDINSVAQQVGDQVLIGEQIGVLGAGGTTETDGERHHLHFGLLIGASTKLQGYVTREADLAPWVDPLVWLAARGAAAVTN